MQKLLSLTDHFSSALGKNYPRSLRFQVPARPSELLADARDFSRAPLLMKQWGTSPLFLTTHFAYFTTYFIMFLPAAVLPKGCTGLVVRS